MYINIAVEQSRKLCVKCPPYGELTAERKEKAFFGFSCGAAFASRWKRQFISLFRQALVLMLKKEMFFYALYGSGKIY